MCFHPLESTNKFYLASFGPPAPVDEAMLVWAEPRNACGPLTGPDVSGAFVLAERGECSFVDKVRLSRVVKPYDYLYIKDRI